MEIKTFYLDEPHIEVVKNVSKQNGDSGNSAALRYIIDDWQRRVERERKLAAMWQPEQVPASP